MTTANVWVSNDLPITTTIDTPTNNIEIESNGADFPGSLTISAFQSYANLIEADGISQSWISFQPPSPATAPAVKFDLGDGLQNTGVVSVQPAPGFAMFYGNIDLAGVLNGLFSFPYANFAVCYGSALPLTYINSVIGANYQALAAYINKINPVFSFSVNGSPLTIKIQSINFPQQPNCYYAAITPLSFPLSVQARVTAMVWLSALIEASVEYQGGSYSINIDIGSIYLYLQGTAAFTAGNTTISDLAFNVTQLMTSTPNCSVTGSVFELALSVLTSLLEQLFPIDAAAAATIATLLAAGQNLDPIVNGPLNSGLISNLNSIITQMLKNF